jgi:TRAF3-interacting protein 1
LSVKSTKVVQGLESEYSCQFLISLADCATDPALDFDEAVRRCLAGEAPGQSGIPLKRGPAASLAAESKEDMPRGGKQSKGGDDQRSERERERKPIASSFQEENLKQQQEIEAQFPADVIAPERGKSRGGTRGNKPNQQSSTGDIGLGGFPSSTIAPKLDAEIEKCDGSEGMTQQLLGELITKPKLTEKLLSKPPFRFLHDVIMEVIRVTGFAKGLYTEFESDSQNVGDKNQKMTFLEKIIKLVGIQLNTLVEARSQRIVAGLDPQTTNTFLQLLAVAAKHMPDSNKNVRIVLEQFGNGENASESSPQQQQQHNEVKQQPQRQEQQDDFRSQQQFQSQNFASVSEPKEQIFSNDDGRKEIGSSSDAKGFQSNTNVDLGEGGEDADSKRSARPTTARRRPPKVKDGATEVQSKDIAPAATKKTTGIIIDGARDDDDDDIIPDESATRLADDMKADSKNDDNIIGGGQNQSKLVQDIKSRQLEQEAAGKARNEVLFLFFNFLCVFLFSPV